MIAPGIVLALPDATDLLTGPAVLRIRGRGGSLDFSDKPARIRRALKRLRSGATEDHLANLAGGSSVATLAEWYQCVATLERSGAVCYVVRARQGVLARGVTLSQWFRPPAEWRTALPRAESRIQLSRFAYMHRVARQLVVESPLSSGRVELHHELASRLIAALGDATTVVRLTRSIPGLSPDAIQDMVWLFGYFGMLTRVSGAGATEEDVDATLRTWHFSDLLYHSRSRVGRHDERFETFRHRRTLEPLPVFKAPMSSETISLFRPDMRAVTRRDAPFTCVLENRRSIRDYGRSPLTLRQLGEFLYRSARIKTIHRADGRRYLYDFSRRPYPGGGACYELEVYVAVRRCRGLDPGFYHYDPWHHRLERLPAERREVRNLIAEARSPSARSAPQVLITLAARFQRVTWKYNAASYAPILKNVGVLLQTMYLVSTAMKLAPCAIGGGNSERFVAVAGTRYLEETSVGEFLLGSRSLASRR
jgi:SagB-type dehydrogenase family enzyme